VLLLFGIMLTRAPVARRVQDNTRRARLGAALVSGAVFAMLTWFMADAFAGDRLSPAGATTLQALGSSLFRNFVLPFEAVSVLLLAALIGAIVLSRRDRTVDADAPDPGAPPEELRVDQPADR
jgi:NADH-quinone oxidoreductase subunit J